VEASNIEAQAPDCNLSVGGYIPQSYNGLPADIAAEFAPPDIEKEVADFEAKMLRQLNMYCTDMTKPFVNKNGPKVRIGFDSEFTKNHATGGNDILSVQFHLVGDDGELKKIVYPKSGEKADRPNFSRMMLKLIMEGMDNGCISEWPSCVIVAGFFLRLDLAAFADLGDFKNELDSAGGKVATIGEGIKFAYDQTGVSMPRKKSSVASDGAGLFILTTYFIDLGRHVVEGTTLDRIGEWLDLPKLELRDGYAKDRMDLLLQGDKPAFEGYAMRDAEITVRFLQHLEVFSATEVDCNVLPATVSSLAVSLLKKEIKSANHSFDDSWGLIKTKTEAWNKNKGKVCSRTETVPCPARQIADPFVIMTYHGGRNECFYVGPTDIGDWFDYDLAGAYTTGLVDLRQIDYDGMRHTTDPQDFVGHVLGFAMVDFEFPPNCRFPSLPVEMGIKGLYFPLTGTSYCTAPEIEVALHQGCKIKIQYGVVFPWIDGDQRVFEPFVTKIRELRARFKRDRVDPNVATLAEEYAKLAGNSAYGKLAQGLKEKSVFDTRGMQSVKLPESAITNAIMASHVTGLVRAVMAEQLDGIPVDFTAVSVTTDGFLTNAPFDKLRHDGSMARRFQALCERVAPGTAMLECKHQVHQLIAAKTRGQMTAIRRLDADGTPMPAVTAKAGVSPPLPKAEHNDYLVELYLNRYPGQMTTTRPFTSLREQWVHELDVVKTERTSLLSLEFDFKRMPINPRMVGVLGLEHLAFDTAPWAQPEIGARARAYFDGWRRQNCLKTLVDWDAWQAHYEFSAARGKRTRAGGANTKRGINMTKDGAVGVMKRLFLRAFTQRLLGVVCEGEKITHQAMADWLTSLGYETKKAAVSNAVRETLVESTVPATQEVTAFLEKVQSRFPAMEVERFLISGKQFGCRE
jgi:hypothetical protein